MPTLAPVGNAFDAAGAELAALEALEVGVVVVVVVVDSLRA